MDLTNSEKRFLARLLNEYATELRDDGFDGSDTCVSGPEALAVRLLKAQTPSNRPDGWRTGADVVPRSIR